MDDPNTIRGAIQVTRRLDPSIVAAVAFRLGLEGEVDVTHDWRAAIAFFGTLVLLSLLGRFLAFRI